MAAPSYLPSLVCIFVWAFISTKKSLVSSFCMVRSPPEAHQRQQGRCQPRVTLPPASFLFMAAEEDNSGSQEKEEDKSLLLGDDLEKQMARLRSKYPTSEADYLAAARARSAAKQASKDRGATDQDWQDIADQKRKEMAALDDWEASEKDAGNADSQILMPFGDGGDKDGDSDEPELLLF